LVFHDETFARNRAIEKKKYHSNTTFPQLIGATLFRKRKWKVRTSSKLAKMNLESLEEMKLKKIWKNGN